MDISIIETSGLGDRSYLVHDGEYRRGHRPAARHRPRPRPGRGQRVRITHVLETHVHNDYVTGGLELVPHRRARVRGAGRQTTSRSTAPPVSGR